MDEKTKAAYRHLLYVAMLAIRAHCPGRCAASSSPLEWYRRYHRGRIAGGLADWLHNVAMFSKVDFVGFKEDLFWAEHQRYCLRFPSGGFERYREIFDKYMAGEEFIC
jgi:hypothetical protein